MSIHRPKRPTVRRQDAPASPRGSSSASGNKPPKWKDVVAHQPDEAFAAYSSAQEYAKDALLSHPKFGKGIVLEVDGNKVQILFEEGIRKLVHATPEV